MLPIDINGFSFPLFAGTFRPSEPRAPGRLDHMYVQRILVVGAGIGGLTAATALARRGVEVDVVDIRQDTNALGIGLIQPANALRAIRALGLLDEVTSVGFQYASNTFHDWHGELIAHCPSVFGPEVPSYNAVGRPDLNRILRSAAEKAGAKITYGVTWQALADSETGITVTLSDGRENHYDLVVGFDGIRSPLRKHLFPTAANPVHSGNVVWRVPLPRPAEVTDLSLYQGGRSKAGLVPLSDEAMYLLHVTPEQANVRHDPADFHRLLKTRLAGYQGLIGTIRDRLPASDQIVYSPIAEVWLPAPWHRGRVIVLGDAAHACAPHLAQGAAMAMEDAIVLAEELDATRHLDDALTAVTSRRFDRASLVQKVSHAIEAEEMAVTADALPAAAERMRAEVPVRLRTVEALLNKPF
jgi:2-polyprenyl-6-methoxyphenol hydroxylase-like FAD-dependent oxidoreductase